MTPIFPVYIFENIGFRWLQKSPTSGCPAISGVSFASWIGCRSNIFQLQSDCHQIEVLEYFVLWSLRAQGKIHFPAMQAQGLWVSWHLLHKFHLRICRASKIIWTWSSKSSGIIFPYRGPMLHDCTLSSLSPSISVWQT